MVENKQRTSSGERNRARPAPIRATPNWPTGTAETLIRLWNAGLSAPQVAARLDTTARAVDSKVRKLRLAGYSLAARRPRSAPRLRRARRTCLYCGRTFASSHAGNRICHTCLETGPFTSAMV